MQQIVKKPSATDYSGDMGVALYAVLALGSIGGMAVLPRRRREK